MSLESVGCVKAKAKGFDNSLVNQIADSVVLIAHFNNAWDAPAAVQQLHGLGLEVHADGPLQLQHDSKTHNVGLVV